MRKLIVLFLISALSVTLFTNCSKNKHNSEDVNKMHNEYVAFVKEYNKIKALDKERNLAYFEASIASNDENWKKYAALDIKINEFLSNKEAFNKIKMIYDSKLITDPIENRHVYYLYLTYLSKNISTTILNDLTNMQTAIEGKYSAFRADVGGSKLSDNDIEDILKTEKDSRKLQQAWEAHKNIGPVVAEDIKNLVRKRNEAAKQLGYNNYHEMSLKLSDQDPVEIGKLFDDLDNLTRDAFAKEKSKMDAILAKECNIQVSELMPWHYQNRYFQEAPKIYNVDIDGFYKSIDIVKTAENYYKSIGLPIEDLVAKSDLFEKPNKNQHAYCINIERDAKDIRVLCNIKQTGRWMETTLHEFGHGLYEKYLDQSLPWDLKTPAHIFTTEAIAMMFGRFASNPQWMIDNINLPKADAEKIADECFKTLKLQQLVFSRWAQVMYRFEKAMYDNPEQDLNKLWWDLVEKYQMIKRPAGRNMPDWATKIHIATSPCYYHNYLMGELFASQLFNTLNTKILKNNTDKVSFINQENIGKYLIENIFKPGSKYYWNDMIERATGEKLTPKYYAIQFVK